MDVEDIVDVERPDERSVMTYISEFYHKFTSQNQKEVAARRIQKFVQFQNSVEEMEENYVKNAKEVCNTVVDYQVYLLQIIF